jgi:hypothetical protein
MTQPVTVELERTVLTAAVQKNNGIAQRAIVFMVRKACRPEHQKNFLVLRWKGLQLVEAGNETMPSGCGCECAGCDAGTYHCHKEDRGCYL